MEHEITENPLRGVEATIGSGHYGVFDQGAHVWSWQPDGAAPVIWMSSKSWYADGQPIRGGVPICFPWFGPGRAGDQVPIHGFARLHTWHLQDVKNTLDRDGRLIVVYTLDNAMTGEQPDWPHRYDARYIVKFTPEYLGLNLEVTNTGQSHVPLDGALHTYLAVGDVRQIKVSGLDGAEYLDKVTGQTETQSGDVTIEGETDRVYRSTGEVVVDDPVLGRKLVIVIGLLIFLARVKLTEEKHAEIVAELEKTWGKDALGANASAEDEATIASATEEAGSTPAK